MNSSCRVTADSKMIISFFLIGCLLSIIGCLLNLWSCLLFSRTKSLFNTPYAIFIIALSISDTIKLIAEYYTHLLFIYIQHPYFVCSIAWYLTMTSENTSYAFLCALGNSSMDLYNDIVDYFSLGVERNIKVWTIDRHWLITRQRACLITLLIIIFVLIYNHPFLYWPLEPSYCYFTLFNHSIIYTCNDAYYHIYGHSFSLTDLLFIENIGLNNIVLPLIIILTNITLVIGLKRRNYHRRYHLGTIKNYDWKERSVILYMLLSSIAFVILTSPVGILGIWGVLNGKKTPTNNLSLIFDLMEIVHHCSHFPILLMTSSTVRKKLFDTRQRKQQLISRQQPIRRRFYASTLNQQQTFLPSFHPHLTNRTITS
jgi:hypothetical protein